jgi:Rieske Fe-S protein
MSNETPSTKPANVTRRRFLTFLVHGGWLAAMGLIVYQMGKFMGARDVLQTGPEPIVVAGTTNEFPPDSTVYVSDAQAWVHNDGRNLQALSAICPHLGCLVQQKEIPNTGYQCPCHGSRFGPHGALERGPAERPLRPLDIQTTENDTVLIRT